MVLPKVRLDYRLGFDKRMLMVLNDCGMVISPAGVGQRPVKAVGGGDHGSEKS